MMPWRWSLAAQVRLRREVRGRFCALQTNCVFCEVMVWVASPSAIAFEVGRVRCGWQASDAWLRLYDWDLPNAFLPVAVLPIAFCPLLYIYLPLSVQKTSFTSRRAVRETRQDQVACSSGIHIIASGPSDRWLLCCSHSGAFVSLHFSACLAVCKSSWRLLCWAPSRAF